MTATEDLILAEIRNLATTVHRLEQTVRCKIETPVVTLALDQAEERAGRTLDRANRLGVFTDLRGGKTQGSKRMYYADEIDAFRTDGAEGVRRLRRELGRD